MNSAAIFRALVDAQAEVVVIGGWAAVVQGVSHVTNDIDLCYNPTPDNRRKLVQAIAPLNPFLRVGRLTAEEARMLPFIWDERTLRDSPNVTLQTDIGDLDLLMRIPGVGDYAHVRAAAKPLDVLGITIPVLDLTALLVSKRATGPTLRWVCHIVIRQGCIAIYAYASPRERHVLIGQHCMIRLYAAPGSL